MSDFYIGYLPRAPKGLARTMRVVVLGFALLVGLTAAVLVTGQQEFQSATFEYGQLRSFHGVVMASPVPLLRVAQPGLDSPSSSYPLVAPGKHGAFDLVRGFDGREVELRGMLIFREGVTMLEVIPGSLHATSSVQHPPLDSVDLGPRTLTGEIVDTKCYAGVMNPGQGKVHRDCAARCISGGIPPALLSGGTLYYLVSGGHPTSPTTLQEYVSRPVIITGRLRQQGSLYYLDIAERGIACARESLKQ